LQSFEIPVHKVALHPEGLQGIGVRYNDSRILVAAPEHETCKGGDYHNSAYEDSESLLIHPHPLQDYYYLTFL
jgi:hypothetical protein